MVWYIQIDSISHELLQETSRDIEHTLYAITHDQVQDLYYKRPSSILFIWFIKQSLCGGAMTPIALGKPPFAAPVVDS